MKATFLNDVVVDILTADEEIDQKFYRRGDTVDVASESPSRTGSAFTSLNLTNGVLLFDIRKSNVTIVE
jgi:hypothetical protein